MIQIIVCHCTQQKFRDAGVNFYSEAKFYQDFKDLYIALCFKHPMFMDRFQNVSMSMSCKCLQQDRWCCNNCKTYCFTLNVIVDKMKVVSLSDIPKSIQLKTIDYLKKDIRSMLFFTFEEIECKLPALWTILTNLI